MTNDLVKFTEALDEFVKELFEIKTEETVVSTQDGEIYSSLFMVSFQENEEGVNTGYITFNDNVPTSTLIRAAGCVIPYLEDGLELDIIVDQCHFLKVGKSGTVSDCIFEDSYTKTMKVKKEAK